MSLEKMNDYKESKKHRKENLAKEKRRKQASRAAWYGVGLLLAVIIIGGIGYTGYAQYKAYQDSLPNYDVTAQLVQDFAGVTETEAEEDEELLEEEEAYAEEEEAVEEDAAEEGAAEDETAEAEE